MAYCRWSTDLSRCDIYAYADVAGGYTVRVAARRREVPDDWIDPFRDVLAGRISAAEWADRANAMYRELSYLPLVDICAPSAGKSFNVPTLGELKKLLLSLRAEGLRFPNGILAVIDAEMRPPALQAGMNDD